MRVWFRKTGARNKSSRKLGSGLGRPLPGTEKSQTPLKIYKLTQPQHDVVVVVVVVVVGVVVRGRALGRMGLWDSASLLLPRRVLGHPPHARGPGTGPDLVVVVV